MFPRLAMATVDKAAVAWTIAIVAFGVGIASMGENLQGSTAPAAPPPPVVDVSPTVDEMMTEEMATDDEAMTEEEEMMMTEEEMAEMEEEMMMTEEEEMMMMMTEEEMAEMEEEMMMMTEEEEMMMMTEEEMAEMEEEEMMMTEEEEMMMMMTEEEMAEEMTEEAETMTEEAETMTEEAETMTEEAETMTEAGPQTVVVTIPEGTSVPGCEVTDECYLPPEVSVSAGDTVSWDNVDPVAHTVTSGTVESGPDGLFDSSLLMGGETFEVTFDSAGSYDYYCIVHPWMDGTVQVS